jgi:AcrR family transcriptional regulator
MPADPTPLSGRRAQAARNDELILDAARAVFTRDPAAPIAAVADQAGVGISALYRRYRSKDELLQRLAGDGLQRYIDTAEDALAQTGDAWTIFKDFMLRCVDAGTSSLTVRFMGAFSSNDELHKQGRHAYAATQHLLERAKHVGALRPEVEVGDISLLFEQLQSVQLGDEERSRQLRRRYLSLLLDGLHARSTTPLPGPAPQWDEITRRYTV